MWHQRTSYPYSSHWKTSHLLRSWLKLGLSRNIHHIPGDIGHIPVRYITTHFCLPKKLTIFVTFETHTFDRSRRFELCHLIPSLSTTVYVSKPTVCVVPIGTSLAAYDAVRANGDLLSKDRCAQEKKGEECECCKPIHDSRDLFEKCL